MAENDETSERRQSIGPHCTLQKMNSGALGNCSPGWFLEEKYRYPVRRGNEFQVYYSGEAVFTDVVQSIGKAQKSVDIIMWGFDPAMPVLREDAEYNKQVPPLMGTSNNPPTMYSGWRKDDAYGTIILKALRDNPNLKIRMVIWYNPVSHHVIKNIVGMNTCLSVSSSSRDRVGIGFEPGSLGDEETLKKLQLFSRSPQAANYSLQWFQQVRWEDFPERDRLAVVFRNIANTEQVGAALNNKEVGTLLRWWNNISEKVQSAKTVINDFSEQLKRDIQSTGVYKEYAELRDTALAYLTQLNDLAVARINDIRRQVEEIPLVKRTLEEIKSLQADITETLDALETQVGQLVADYLSEQPPIDYIEKLRATRISLLVSIAELLDVNEEEVNYLSNYSERGSLLFATDHQKMILVDYEDAEKRHGYVMGHNSTTNYWSRFPFRHRDPKNEMSLPPYHDFSMKVRGQLLIDLNHNFCEAWDKNRISTLSSLGEDEIPFPSGNAKANRGISPPALETESPGQLESSRKQYEAEILSQFAQGGANGQIVRTRPDQKFDDGFQEKEVKDAYLQATRQASNYILIVNQYCQYPALIRHIKHWRRQRRDAGLPGTLYIFMGTCKPEQDGQVFAAQQMANELGVGAQFVKAEDELYDKDRADGDGRRVKTWRGAWADARPHVVAKDLDQLDIKVLFFMFYTQISQPTGTAPATASQEASELSSGQFVDKTLQSASSTAEQLGSDPLLDRVPGNVPQQAQQQLNETGGQLRDPAVQAMNTAEGALKTANNAAQQYLPPLPEGHESKTPAQMREELKRAATPTVFASQQPAATQEDAPLPPDRIAQQPYVHAKLMVEDDMFLTLGSSNLNIRSMAIDSELNLITDDHSTAQPVRHELFNVYSGEPYSEKQFPNTIYNYAQGVSAQQMQDHLEKVFFRMSEIAFKNAERVKEGECIQGYIASFEDSRTALGMRVS